MDLETILEFENRYSDDNDVFANGTQDDDATAAEHDFIKNNPTVAVPYLLMICLATLFGTTGNIFIIGAVLMEKVGHSNVFFCRNFYGGNIVTTCLIVPMSNCHVRFSATCTT